MVGDVDIAGNLIHIGMSVGVAVYPADGTETDVLLANADAALHRAKAEARGSIRFFAPAMDKRLREKRALQHDLRSAVAHGELVLYYQPQATIGGDVVGFEALVRWKHPIRGMVPPAEFIPLAEETSLSYLQSFPFDKIKIDQAFIANLERSPQSAAIIRAVIGLGRGLELPIVAEGVENDAQLVFLTREECNEVQGYLIGRPEPIERYSGLVGRQAAVPGVPAQMPASAGR